MPSLIDALYKDEAIKRLYEAHYRDKRTKILLERILGEPPIRRRVKATLAVLLVVSASFMPMFLFLFF